MNRINHILKVRQIQGKTWNEIAEGLSISGNALRIAFVRESVNDTYLDHCEFKLGIAFRNGYKKAIETTDFEDTTLKQILAELKTIRRLLEAKTT